MATITRSDLSDAVYREVGLSRTDSARFVDAAIEAIVECLATGEAVKISGFGSFLSRGKGARMGRNPKTGESAQIPARRVIVYRSSRLLTHRVQQTMSGARDR